MSIFDDKNLHKVTRAEAFLRFDNNIFSFSEHIIMAFKTISKLLIKNLKQKTIILGIAGIILLIFYFGCMKDTNYIKTATVTKSNVWSTSIAT